MIAEQITDNTEEKTTFKVPVTKIREIIPHGNADALEVALVYGFEVVIRKNQYRAGDSVVFIPPDSILPQRLENAIFGEGSKIKLDKHRVRQIRIRGRASQGMLISMADAYTFGVSKYVIQESDVSETLGIVKYEPPAPVYNTSNRSGMSRDKTYNMKLFHSYNGINNIKWYPDLFESTEQIVIQEKLHGSNMRISMLPHEPKNLWQRIKKLIGLAPKYEFNYGSNNVQISRKTGYRGFYDIDIYGECVQRLGLETKVPENHIVYGELIGTTIQKNYNYGHSQQNHFVVFDVKIIDPVNPENSKWLSPHEVKQFCDNKGLDMVPVLYEGLYSKEVLDKHVSGSSVYWPAHKVREGIVIKSMFKYNDLSLHSGRRSLKYLNPEYLDDKDNTDNH